MSSFRLSARPLALALATAALAASRPAQAQAYTWTGNGLSWSDGFSPTLSGGGSVTTDLVFGVNGNGTSTNDLVDNFLVRSLTFAGRAWALKGKSVRFAPGGKIIATDGFAHSVVNAVSLNGALTVNVATATSLALNGRITDTSGYTGSLIKAGAGTLSLGYFVANGSNPTINAYTGSTTIQAGTIRADADDVFGHGGFPVGSSPTTTANKNLILAGGALDLNGHQVSVNDLDLGNGTAGLGDDGTGTNVGSVSGGRLVVYNNVNYQGGQGRTINPALVTANLVLQGSYSNGHLFSVTGTSSGAYDAVIAGAISSTLGAGAYLTTDDTGIIFTGGAWALTGQSTYTGRTVLQPGTILTLGRENALPASTGLLVNGSAGGVARLVLDPTVSGNGVTAGSYSQTVASLGGGGRIDLGAATLTVDGGIDSTFSGILADGAGVGGSLVRQGTGTLTLSGKNAYTGATTINGGTLAVGITNALPTAGKVTVGAAGTLALTGGDQTLPSLTGSGTVSLGTHRLTLGNGTDFAFSGTFAGGGVLDKVGVGRLDLNGADLSGLTGTLQVDAGTVDLAQADLSTFTGAVRVNDGTLITSASNKGSVFLGSTTATYEIAEDGAATFTASVTGTGTLRKTGSGIVRFGDGSFAGQTKVSEGGLLVIPGSIYTSSRGFSVDAGASVRLGSFDTILASPASYFNSGTLQGTGEVDATYLGLPSGKVLLSATDTLTIGSGANNNPGLIGVAGGALTVRGTLTNDGQISGHGSFDFDGGLTILKGGSLTASGATTDVFGPVTVGSKTLKYGSVFSSGRGTLTFHAPVVNNATQFVTGDGSSTVFVGRVTGAGSFTGKGLVEFDGGYSPGNSPAAVTIDGDMALGSANDLTMELGGTTLGTGYDHLTVNGLASLDGALDVVDYGGFTASVGQSFDLFDFAQETGAFSSVTLPSLESGLQWDTSALYTTGVIRVVPQAVPEPAALLPLAFGALAVLRRRK